MPNMIAQITIALSDDGSISVNGPIDNKLLALGLLEVAKDTVTQHCRENEKGKRILQPPPGLAGVLRNQ